MQSFNPDRDYIVTTHHALKDLMIAVRDPDIRDDLIRRNRDFLRWSLTASAEPLEEAFRAYLYVLNQAIPDGIELTASGYLRPDDVRALAEHMPAMDRWNFAINREINTQPVMWFRQHVVRSGLLRKWKSSLRITKRGAVAVADPEVLWRDISSRLIPRGNDFTIHAAVCFLLFSATENDSRATYEQVARVLASAGWKHTDLTEIDVHDVYEIGHDLWTALGNIGTQPREVGFDRRLSTTAKLVMRDALFEFELADSDDVAYFDGIKIQPWERTLPRI